MRAKNMYMDYGFMKSTIGEFRCHGVEIDDDTPVFMRLASKTRDSSYVLCVAEIHCKCGKYHLVKSERTIQEQIDEYMGEIRGNKGSLEDKENIQYIDDDYRSCVWPTDKARVFSFINRWTSDEVNYFDSMYDYVTFYKIDCSDPRLNFSAKSLYAGSVFENNSYLSPDPEENDVDCFRLPYYEFCYVFEKSIHNGKEYYRVNNGEKATSFILSSRLWDDLYNVVTWKKIEKGYAIWRGWETTHSAYLGVGGETAYKTREEAEKAIIMMKNN